MDLDSQRTKEGEIESPGESKFGTLYFPGVASVVSSSVTELSCDQYCSVQKPCLLRFTSSGGSSLWTSGKRILDLALVSVTL